MSPAPPRPPDTPAAPPPRARLIAFLALVTGAALVGASPLFVRASEIGPAATAFHRAFLALPLLFLVLALNRARGRRPGVPRLDIKAARGMALAGMFFAGDLAFWHLAILGTTVANATLFATLAPIWVTLFLVLVVRVRLAARYLLGVGLAVAGGGLLVADSLTVRPENLVGDAHGLITGMFLGAYMLSVGRLRGRGFSTLAIMSLGTLSTALFLLPPALLLEDQLFPRSVEGWAILVGLAWSAQALGQGLVAFSLAYLPIGFSATTMILEAVFAALLAWVLLGEALGPWQAAGALAVLAGLLLARRGEGAAPRPDRVRRPGSGP
ncbi:DMT family transporter [Roseospirillum parvum]|uniref:Threonine/homoserine efflux transporter RhtA n=1 Tax=Roseospirillum parvum TaxID=83401 RepID=A0A1G8AQH9_9PROT|nr:DMT family transporter [Roseospirillum parvum]SDH23312.1 Threonine/homoserine efflux transporter RhtA [Roseospirillum parvum]